MMKLVFKFSFLLSFKDANLLFLIDRSLNAKVLIDDNPRYAIECAEVGIRVLLFDYENSYPWSKNELVDAHPLVTKVKNWKEVEQQLMSLVAS